MLSPFCSMSVTLPTLTPAMRTGDLIAMFYSVTEGRLDLVAGAL